MVGVLFKEDDKDDGGFCAFINFKDNFLFFF